MSNGLPKYDFLYDNNTFPVSSISGLRDFNKNTMDPSFRTRAGSLQSFIKVVYGLFVCMVVCLFVSYDSPCNN